MNPKHILAGRLGRLSLPQVTLLASLALGFAAQAVAGAPQEAPASAPSSTPAPSEKSAEKAAATKPVDSAQPAKTFYVDAKTGNRYSIESIPKVEGTYKWVSDSHVRFPGGATFEIIDHDASAFRVKAWEPKAEPETKVKKVEVDPAKIEAEYRFELKEVDRLTLANFGTGLPDRGQWRNGFDLADMDKNGHLDLIFGPARKGRAQPNIFLSDGQGTWKRAEQLRFPPEPFDYGDVAVGDFNGDGTQDMAFAIHLRGVLVIASDGQGGYQTWSKGIALDRPGAPPTAYSSRAIDTVDWDGDGKLDIMVSGEGPKGLKSAPKDGAPMDSSRGIRIFLNQGDGSWKVVQSDDGAEKLANFTDTFAMADFNKDGKLDVFTGTRQVGNKQLLGLRQADGALQFADFPWVRPNALVLTVAASDLDRDGFTDMVVGYQSREGQWRGGVDLFWGGKTSWTRQTLFNREGRTGISAVATGDVDGDGHQDIVAFSQDAENFILLGDGKRQFVAEKSVGELPATRSGCSASQVTLVDLNGDRRDEIIVSFAGEPTGYPGIVETPGCINEGSINVWTPAPKAE